MSDWIIALAYVAFLGGGLFAAFVFSLGYVWVDAFGPQYVGRYVLGPYPVSAIIAIAAFMGYVLLDRRSPPRIGLSIILMVLMAGWMTLTMEWAVRPESAWRKWDWAFNAVVFAAFMPFAIRTRVQIEAMLQIFLLGSGMHLIGTGIKSAITGGGYNQHVTLLPPDTGLAESSAMATVAIMVIPLLFVLRQHSLLLPFPRLRTGFYIFYGITCLTAMVGTGARTGLVCVAVLALLVWQRSKHKLVAGVTVVLVGALLVAFAPQRWESRMATIEDFNQESSALTRIKIWQWSLGFVRDNPLGGGLRAYEVSVIHMPPDAFHPEGWIQRGRAPHSTWFEVLTELGIPGAIMFGALICLSFLSLYRTRRRTRDIPDLAWAHDLSLGLMHALLILMAGATFIGIGFKPWFWLLFSAAIALSECVRRSLAEPVKVARFVPAAPAPAAARGLAGRGRA